MSRIQNDPRQQLSAGDKESWRIFRIMAEFVEGFEVMGPVGRAVSVFGSARSRPQSKYFKAAEQTTRQSTAVAAASEAFAEWSNMPVAKRSNILLKISSLIEKNLDRLAIAESIDQGKPVWLAKNTWESSIAGPAKLRIPEL